MLPDRYFVKCFAEVRIHYVQDSPLLLSAKSLITSPKEKKIKKGKHIHFFTLNKYLLSEHSDHFYLDK